MIRFVVVAGLASTSLPLAAHTIFAVNSVVDLPDAAPGDGTCAAAGGACTLRAAIMESRATPGGIGDFIVRLPPGTYALSHVAGDGAINAAAGDLDFQPPPSADSLTLEGWAGGAPPAAAQRPVITAAPDFPRRLMETVGFAGQALRVRDVVFAGSRPQAWGASVADNGAAIQCRSQQGATLDLKRVRFADNEVPDAVGGAIYSTGCRLDLADVEFDANCGRAAALVSGYQPLPILRRITLDRVSFTRNRDGCLDLQNPQNHALLIQSNLPDEPWEIAIANTTLGDNLGGSRLVASAGVPSDLRTVLLRNVTMHANSVDYLGHDGLAASGDMRIQASHAVLGLLSRIDAGARLVSLGASAGAVFTGTGGTFDPHPTDLGNAPLAFAPLQRLGDYTQGYTPIEDSLLVDSGAAVADDVDFAACPMHDQENRQRPVGGACDVGAVEFASYRVFADGFE